MSVIRVGFGDARAGVGDARAGGGDADSLFGVGDTGTERTGAAGTGTLCDLPGEPGTDLAGFGTVLTAAGATAGLGGAVEGTSLGGGAAGASLGGAVLGTRRGGAVDGTTGRPCFDAGRIGFVGGTRRGGAVDGAFGCAAGTGRGGAVLGVRFETPFDDGDGCFDGFGGLTFRADGRGGMGSVGVCERKLRVGDVPSGTEDDADASVFADAATSFVDDDVSATGGEAPAALAGAGLRNDLFATGGFFDRLAVLARENGATFDMLGVRLLGICAVIEFVRGLGTSLGGAAVVIDIVLGRGTSRRGAAVVIEFVRGRGASGRLIDGRRGASGMLIDGARARGTRWVDDGQTDCMNCGSSSSSLVSGASSPEEEAASSVSSSVSSDSTSISGCTLRAEDAGAFGGAGALGRWTGGDVERSGAFDATGTDVSRTDRGTRLSHAIGAEPSRASGGRSSRTGCGRLSSRAGAGEVARRTDAIRPAVSTAGDATLLGLDLTAAAGASMTGERASRTGGEATLLAAPTGTSVSTTDRRTDLS